MKPQARHRDTPVAGGCLKVVDVIEFEEFSDLQRLVVGHVAQLKEELRHGRAPRE